MEKPLRWRQDVAGTSAESRMDSTNLRRIVLQNQALPPTTLLSHLAPLVASLKAAGLRVWLVLILMSCGPMLGE